MLQLLNRSPFAAKMFVLGDEHGVDTLFAVTKATFELNESGLRVASTQPAVRVVDEYWGDPASSSVRYPGEAHPHKPGTDVLVLGHAYPPGRRAGCCRAAVRVGPVGREIVVSGERVWIRRMGALVPSAPAPFERIPLVYERAYGGVLRLADGRLLADERNPVGRGFLGSRRPEEMFGQALPNLEDPACMITRPGDAPEPVGFGPLAPQWLSRRALAGTYDEAWSTRRAPHLPLDFNPAFFHTAPPAMQSPYRLIGGESVELINCSMRARQCFELPRCVWTVEARIAGRKVPLVMALETVLLEPDREQVSMTWRGAARCDKNTLRVEEMCIELRELTGARD